MRSFSDSSRRRAAGTRTPPPASAEPLGRGGFAGIAYRLGRAGATGVVTIYPCWGPPELLLLRRGHLMAAELDDLGRGAEQRLERLAALDHARWHFDGGTAAHPPGASIRQFSLAAWARRHLERQLDSVGARALAAELAGVRLGIRPELAPPAALCDDTDRRILAAMTPPRLLDQLAAVARAPRFRLLTFVHFLRRVGAIELAGVAAPAPGPVWPAQIAARRVLGVPASADRTEVKRAYRRLARALHPDLHPQASGRRRRELEAKLAAVTIAYRQLVGASP